MSFLSGIEEVRAVEWAVNYLWDIRFEDAPAPFNKFFPAIDIEEPIVALESHRFSGYNSQFKFPKSTIGRVLRVTFYDRIDLPIKNWLIKWIREEALHLNNGNNKFIGYLEDIVKLVHVQKLNAKREALSTNSYWVYPEGTISFIGNSGSEINTTTLNFVVAGDGRKL